jgi:branched-chain amino acid aminotransferase
MIERDIARAELYLAEEVFLTGTAAEMVPVREIDDHDIGGPGEITRHIQAKFMDALHGRADEYLEWLDFVDIPAQAGPAGERDGAAIGAEEIESTNETIGRITPAA